MKTLSDTKMLFQLLGSKLRLRMLKLVESGELYSAQIAHIVNLSAPSACRYLNAMAEAGLLKKRETTLLVFYSLAGRNTPGGKIARLACARLEGDPVIAKDRRLLDKDRILRNR